MYFISNEIGKPVTSLFEMKTVGIVTNILFCNKTKKAKYLIITEEDDYQQFVISVDAIFHFGEDYVTIKNVSALQPYENLMLEISGYFNPIFDKIISPYGKYFGFVKDISINRCYKISHFVDNLDNIINLKDIVCFNHHTVLVKDKQKFTLAQMKPKSIQDIKPITEQIVTISQPPLKTPTKTITNYNFLIDRIVNKNIIANNGDLLIKKDTRVNSQTIDKARTFGKLKELVEYSIPQKNSLA